MEDTDNNAETLQQVYVALQKRQAARNRQHLVAALLGVLVGLGAVAAFLPDAIQRVAVSVLFVLLAVSAVIFGYFLALKTR